MSARWRWLPAAAIAVLALAHAAGDAQPRPVLFPDGVGPLRLSGNHDACRECHAAIVEEWESSAHAASWTSPVFQAEYAPAREAFCRKCHAPRAMSVDVGASARHGIDCAVCHERDGHILGREGVGGDAHQIRVAPELGQTSFCAPCHEFAFPHRTPGAGRPTYLPGQPLQATISEHRESAARRDPCQSCHMPRRDGHVDHRFPALSDPSMMRNAVRVSARARELGEGRVRVHVRLTPGEIGHAFPTGDMFRQARFEVRRGDARAVERLQRWFAQVPSDDAFYMGQVDDTRVPARGAYIFALDLPPGDGAIRYRLDLYRLDPDVARRRGLDEDLVRVPVSAGIVR